MRDDHVIVQVGGVTLDPSSGPAERPSEPATLTYDELLALLRKSDALGDCVPDDLERAARELVGRVPR